MSNILFEKIKKYSLLSLLENGANEIRIKFNKNEAYDTVEMKEGRITRTAWNLSDLNYLAVVKASELSLDICSETDYFYLLNEQMKYDEDQLKDELSKISDDQDKLLLILWGMARTQFWYQELFRIKNEFNRQVEILEKCNTKMDLDLACQSETGFPIHDFRVLNLVLAGITNESIYMDQLNVDEITKTKYPICNSKNLSIIRNILSCDYECIRNSRLDELTFYIWPILRTYNKKYIVTNRYLLFIKIVDGPLWAIRNYYSKLGSDEFVIYYGELFEVYLENMLKNNLKECEYRRIDNSRKVKLADWIIESPIYRIIIEQKAYLPELMLKKKIPDIEKVKNYLQKYEKAIKQLDSTENEITSSKTTVKMVLVYDDLEIANGPIKDYIIGRLNGKIKSNKNILFIDITSFERMISLFREDVVLFDRIITEKLLNDNGESMEGYEFSQILNKYDYYKLSCPNHWETYFG